MKKTLLLSTLFLTSCTVYTEKQSEALSQNVYATSDSLNMARVDLAYYYSTETTKLISQPKHRISIQPVYEASTVTKTQGDKIRVVIVPKEYVNDKVVVVNSKEYQDLLKDRATAIQLKKDYVNLQKAHETTDKEVVLQKSMHDKMVKDLNHLQTEIYKKDAAIWRRNFVIIGLTALLSLLIYLRVSRLLFF